MKKTILIALAAATISLSSVSAQAAVVKEGYCDASLNFISAKAKGSWSDTNGNRFHVSVIEPNGTVAFEHDTDLLWFKTSTIAVWGGEIDGVPFEISSSKAILRLWDTDGTFDQSFICDGTKTTYSATVQELTPAEKKLLIEQAKSSLDSK